ncbi:hypothetical protein NE237_031398 [Protea cynaroides]|uniref:KIB1-4 beta-propeller domain-containing protein n=1 Tax=Protea cynaroides TaxID=273540 RepID=A0A9Q0L1G4_9MAGN|nr:hypothetical protein NE237_031398 [Protea cynaroides]
MVFSKRYTRKYGGVFASTLVLSSSPISLDCIVFGISSSWICIISRGEASWTIHHCQDNNQPFVPSNVNPVYHNGLFYCLGEDGNLGIFDTQGQDIQEGNSFFLECNDNLFVVIQGHMGKGVFVFVLDPHKKIWNQVQHLEDHMFFSISQISHSAKTVQAFDEMANKIYFPMFSPSYDGSSSGGDISSCVFYSLSGKINCAWVESNFVIASDKDLIWAISSVIFRTKYEVMFYCLSFVI